MLVVHHHFGKQFGIIYGSWKLSITYDLVVLSYFQQIHLQVQTSKMFMSDLIIIADSSCPKLIQSTVILVIEGLKEIYISPLNNIYMKINNSNTQHGKLHRFSVERSQYGFIHVIGFL